MQKRKKLSLKHRDIAPSESVSSNTPEERFAHALLAMHGTKVGQELVDLVQAAVRAGDDDRMKFLDRVRAIVEKIPSKS